MTATLESTEDILKDYYDSTKLEKSFMVKSPTIAVIPKRTDFRGAKAPLPFQYAPSGGVSTDFPTAQNNKRDASEEKWQIITNDIFSLFSLDHKTMELSKGDGAAFVDLVESRAEAADDAAMKMYAKYIFGTGGGGLAEVVGGGGGATLTLTNRADMHVFDRNMTVTVAATDGGTDLHAETVIGHVNRQARTMTVLGGGNWPAAFSAGRIVHLAGSVGVSATTGPLRGFGGWMPLTDPASTAWFDVDRTQDSRMWGVIHTVNVAEENNIEEALLGLLADVNDQGGDPDVIVMNTRALRQLVKQLGVSVVRGNVMAQGKDGPIAEIGFSSVKIRGDNREVDIIGDRNCPYTLAYALQTDTCRIWSVGDMLKWLRYQDDDTHFLRHGTQNALEGRKGGYAQFCMRTPGFCGVTNLEDLLEDDT